MTARLTLAVAVGVAVGLASVTGAAAAAEDARRPKKLIASGWDKPDSERLLKNLALMEKRPFDGVIIAAEGRMGDGKICRMRTTFSAEPWKREWFGHTVRNLKACRFTRFTDNFVQVGANPGNVDWFDDDGWRQIVDHWRIAAWVAKQGGLKGLLFDPEPYSRPHAQFSFAAQPERDRHTFDAYAEKARERGRQVMAAVVAEFPDPTLLCYFMNSVCTRATGHRDPNRILSTLTYGLLPAFLDGWLDAAPPGVTLVDGCERAYRFNSVGEYLESAVAIKGACQELVSPENRAKYRTQVQVSFGTYLDAYWNPKGSEWDKWYIDGLGGARVERLRANAQTALRVADEYVWLYGEKFHWWPTPNPRVKEKSWPEALPGCEDAIRYARDPVEYGRYRIAEMAKAGTLTNLAANGGFDAEKVRVGERQETWRPGGPPAGWGAWQKSDSKGAFTWDRAVGAAAAGAGCIRNVSDGCFIQHREATPGERYAVGAVRKLQGRGDALLRVRWQTADEAWTATAADKVILCDGPRDDWAEGFGVVEVPQGAGHLVILLLVRGQASDEDVAWFDDVRLYRLD